MNPNGMVWQLAHEYSDPAFTDLYVDLLPGGDMYSPRISLGDPVSPMETRMTVILRDKPFPVLTASAPPGYVASWNALPLHTVGNQEIRDKNVGRSGYERYNAFFVSERILQEGMGSYALEFMAPLLDRDSIKRHGLRRFDVQSNVVPDPQNPVTWGGIDAKNLARYQQAIARDWYCLNPYFLSGTIALGHSRPDIKIGNRLQIPGTVYSPKDTESDETYYIETVQQNWQARVGNKTTVGVTRGWAGTDAEYTAALTKMAARYSLPALALTLP
jgi:hypothetical protein